MSTEELRQITTSPTPPPKPPRTKQFLEPGINEDSQICDKSTQSGPSFIDGNVLTKSKKEKTTKKQEESIINITTVQTIYTSETQNESNSKIPVRSTSRVDKSMYLKLHPKTPDTQVNKLKENFEGAAEDAPEPAETESANIGLDTRDLDALDAEPKEEKSPGPTNKEIGLLRAKFPPEALLARKQRKSLPASLDLSDDAPEPKPRPLLNQKEGITKTELLQKRREIQGLKFGEVKTKDISAPQFPRIVKSVTESRESDDDSAEEYRNIVVRSEPEDIDTTVLQFLSEIEMEKKPSKKRTSGLRRIFSGTFFSSSKDKARREEDRNKALKNTKYLGHLSGSSNSNQSFGAFDRNAPQRHTTTGNYNSYMRNINVEPLYVNTSRDYEAANAHSERATDVGNKASTNFDDIQYNRMIQQQRVQQKQQQHLRQHDHPLEDYVCMDNGHTVKQRLPGGPSKYIDENTSSSSNTLSSENKSYNDNSPQVTRNLPKVQNSSRSGPPVPPKISGRTSAPIVSYTDRLDRDTYANTPERFTETPPRASETRPNLQIVKPRAVIPINTERQLPNYRDIQPPSRNQKNVYGNLPSPGRSKLENGSPRTLERNMNTSTTKNLPVKNNVVFEETYGTVFDSLKPVGAQLKTTRMSMQTAESLRARSMSPERNISSPTFASSISPKSPTLEGSKLRLPPNRERMNVTPRITSPIDKRLSAEKIIATELLKQKPTKDANTSRALSPSHQRLDGDFDYPDNVQNKRGGTLERVNNERIRNSRSEKAQTEKINPGTQQQLTRSHSLSQHSTLPMQSRARNGNYDVIVERRTMDPRMSLQRGITLSQQIPQSPTKEETKKILEDYYWTKRQEEIAREDPYASQTINTRVVIHTQPRSQSMQALHMMRSPTPVILMRTQPSSPAMQQFTSVRSSTPQLSPQARSMTPVNSAASSSPQKQQSRQNVEAFYWQELRRLKDQEEQQLYNKQMQLATLQDQDNRRRSRSASPAVARPERSMSLPRNPGQVVRRQVRGNDLYGYTRSPPYQAQQIPIREGIPVDLNSKVVCYLTPEEYVAIRAKRIQEIQAIHEGAAPRNNPNFVRGSPQRNTIGPMNLTMRPDGKVVNDQQQTYAPIFKRGSLASTASMVPESNSPKDFKRVSFSSAQNVSPVWPTKNGFTQSPPQRRIVKNEGMDDEVFLPNSPKPQGEPVYGQRVADPKTVAVAMQQNAVDGPYGNNQQEALAARRRQEELYARGRENVQRQAEQTSPKKTAKQHAAELFSLRKEAQKQHQVSPNAKNQGEDPYGRTGDKQITVNNKVCDIYGRIHDSSNYGQIQKSGVLYGHIQRSPVGERTGQPPPQSNFVRGTRLTASVSDMYNNRRPMDQMDAPDRPLPPLPGQRIAAHYVLTPRRTGPVSDTESGSEAGEVQRILLTGKHRTKDRRNGFGE